MLIGVVGLPAHAALEAGARSVNDVSALAHDQAAARVVADAGAAVVLMHMRGTPQTMQDHAAYQDVAAEVCRELAARIAQHRDQQVRSGIGHQALVDEARRHLESGYKAVKLRLGDNPKDDLARVAAIRKAFAPQFEGKFGPIQFIEDDTFIDAASGKVMKRELRSLL